MKSQAGRNGSAAAVREAARMTGVSSGAPFRHFSSRRALLTAVAEEAMDRFCTELDRALAETAAENALLRFRAMGIAFLRWAIANPTHFRVLSDRTAIDFEGSSLRRRNDEIRARMTALLREAHAAGLLRSDDIAGYQIGGRALVYGLARMYVDGQFPSWDLDERAALGQGEAIVDQFLGWIARDGKAAGAAGHGGTGERSSAATGGRDPMTA
jgi:AcrR family transcriptional regulator